MPEAVKGGGVSDSKELPDLISGRQLVLPLEYPLKDFQLLDDTQGKIKHVLLSYNADNMEDVLRDQLRDPVKEYFEALIGEMDSDVRFTIVCRHWEVDYLLDLQESNKGRVRLHPSEQGMSLWVQDNLHSLDSSYGVALLPGIYSGQGVENREFIDIVKDDPALDALSAVKAADIVSDESNIFVSARAIDILRRHKNQSEAGEKIDRQQARKLLLDSLEKAGGGRKIHVIGEKDPMMIDLDLFFMTAGAGRVLVGDANKTLEILQTISAEKLRQYEQMFGEEGVFDKMLELTSRVGYVEKLDSIADELGAHFDVSRLPFMAKSHVGSMRDPPILTYSNVLLENYDVLLEGHDAGGKHVSRAYMPVYGMQEFDSYSAGVYEGIGYDVTPVRGLLDIARFGGLLRCASKIVERQI